MSLSYFNVKKFRRQSKQAEPTEETVEKAVDAAVGKPASPPAPAVSTPSEEPAASPVLDEEDEKFMARLAAIAQEPEGERPPLPTRPAEVVENGEKKEGRDAQEALMDGADKVPLPMSPPEVTVSDADKQGLGRKKSVMGYFALAQSRFKKATEKKDADGKAKEKDQKKAATITPKDKQRAADDLLSAAESAKTEEQKEKEKEQQDLTAILDDLNLSAVNNRVFSFSKESEELFGKFTLVLKDIVNGVPTAYDDLEKLFTEYDANLKKMYGNLPPFLQNMVKSLPAKMTAALGPEILAATAEKPGFDAKQKQTWQDGAKSYAKKKAKQKAKIPSLKSLLSAEGAVATMLRSILNFLKLRFPAILTGTNILMSLAVCLLLFVFWYCHKRGRETRLEKQEREKNNLTAEGPEGGDSALASSASSIASDADSIFASNANLRGHGNGESSRQGALQEETQPPLVISDERGQGLEQEKPRATVADLPSVKDLPDPAVAR
ncbi:hypothetical protein DPSP01_011210 [Paraphaeosphaeria sporulosa]|uniref:Uncharacterized protein n=1 Tax=Paraphaeosphaeria sporulosa TaxID=1460663 RepID=A0A177CLI6_9PLEO|nr:uncharacterized protein CC84DRAFT_1141075 [Paraphaeosphaeria sporulosa]OAG08395.1 hypothetical protein CC84DRAFT_1141075 [Paraphaeosphaeria sporulosa]